MFTYFLHLTSFFNFLNFLNFFFHSLACFPFIFPCSYLSLCTYFLFSSSFLHLFSKPPISYQLFFYILYSTCSIYSHTHTPIFEHLFVHTLNHSFTAFRILSYVSHSIIYPFSYTSPSSPTPQKQIKTTSRLSPHLTPVLFL